MSWKDVELACELIGQRDPGLAVQPSRIRIDLPFDPQAPKNVVGYTTFPFNRIRLSRKFDGNLSEAEAVNLLKVLIHECIHLHSGLLKRLRDFFDDAHTDVYRKAEELSLLWKDEYLRRRRTP